MPLSPLVSVIIPTWNRKHLLAKAVASVLNQRNVSVEVMVCDDGSTDGTAEMIAGWADARIRLLSCKNAGRPAIPRNRGIAAAQGEWIAFLDDDDIWLPRKLENQLMAAQKNSALAVCSNALRLIPGNKANIPYLAFPPKQLDFKALCRCNYVITSSAMFHRSLLPKVIGFPEEKRYTAVEDYALWLRIASLTPFLMLPVPQLIYRDSPETSIRSKNNSDKESIQDVFLNWCRWAEWRVLSKHGIYAGVRLAVLFFPTLAKFFNYSRKFMPKLWFNE